MCHGNGDKTIVITILSWWCWIGWISTTRARKSTFKSRVPLKIPKRSFLQVRDFLRPKIEMAATMLQNVPKVNKYGGAHDQNVNKYGYM